MWCEPQKFLNVNWPAGRNFSRYIANSEFFKLLMLFVLRCVSPQWLIAFTNVHRNVYTFKVKYYLVCILFVNDDKEEIKFSVWSFGCAGMPEGFWWYALFRRWSLGAHKMGLSITQIGPGLRSERMFAGEIFKISLPYTVLKSCSSTILSLLTFTPLLPFMLKLIWLCPVCVCMCGSVVCGWRSRSWSYITSVSQDPSGLTIRLICVTTSSRYAEYRPWDLVLISKATWLAIFINAFRLVCWGDRQRRASGSYQKWKMLAYADADLSIFNYARMKLENYVTLSLVSEHQMRISESTTMTLDSPPLFP